MTSAPDPGGSIASAHTTQLLLRRIRDGDEAARELLLRRVVPLFERWARGRLPAVARGALATDDLVQVTLLRALRGLDRFESAHPGAFFAYLRRILLNAAKRSASDAAAAGPHLPIEDAGELPAEPGSALEALVGRDNLLAYEQALSRLSEAHQALVVMRFELGMSFPEIAEEVGESADGVRIKLGRALARMRTDLDDATG